MSLDSSLKVVESATIEKLYIEMKPKLLRIADGVIRKRGLGLAEASDLLNEAFAFGFIERWISSFDFDARPSHLKAKTREAELDIAAIPDDWSAEQVRNWTEQNKKSSVKVEVSFQEAWDEALRFWIMWKFRYFCGDQLRRKVQQPTLHLDYNRGKEGTAVKVTAVQLEETFDVAVQPKLSDEQPSEYLEYCSDIEADVLHRMYWLGQTRTLIADLYGCHPNTISALRKSAEEKIRAAIR